MAVLATMLAAASLTGCAIIDPPEARLPLPAATAPLCFALSFDDGPSGERAGNPTEQILEVLADNPVQKGIKAVYFLQTRSSDGGATERGRALIRRQQAEGHVIALHDGSTWGHRSHRNLDDAELERSLADGLADIATLTGVHAHLLRPPYWAWDQRTLAAYRRHGLRVVLTDISANDGKDWGFKASPRRYVHMAAEMQRLRARLVRGELPALQGVTPVVVTFHDTNSYTAEHMLEYLHMLVDEARSAGLPLADPPFYANGERLEQAVSLRAPEQPDRDMVPWWWRWMLW